MFLTESDFVRVMALQPDALLRAELERAIVVAPESIPSDVVTMHSQVRYMDESTKLSRQVQIVYPDDADVDRGKVSVLAPVGAALLGLTVGQSIDWTFPAGETRRLRVEHVVYQPETSLREKRQTTTYPR
ncbi:MAG: nucleoside diphosphate kinase regulator [Casimicrobiaceae bacterium]